MPVLPSELKIGAGVYSSDGHKLGELHRFVVRRSDLALSHVVIDIGFLRSGHHLWEGGLGLDYDRVVPVEAVRSATDERVELGLSAGEFKEAPEYSMEAFEEPYDLTPNEFDLPDVANRANGLAAILSSTPGAWLIEKLNKPLDGVDIAEGTDIWRQHPHEKLGEVQRVLLDAAGRVQAFVIKRGFLFTKEVVFPARYVTELIDEIIRVDLLDEDLAQLREYEET